MPPDEADPSRSRIRTYATVATLLMPTNFLVWLGLLYADEPYATWLAFVFTLAALLQLATGVTAVLLGRNAKRRGVPPPSFPIALAVIAVVAAPVGWFLGAVIAAFSGVAGA